MTDKKATAGEYRTRGEYHRHLDKSWRYYPVYVEKMGLVRRYLDGVPRHTRILDMGCGEGLLVEEYRDRGFTIEGADLNYSSPCVTQCSITDLPFEPASFGLVLALDVLEHLLFDQQQQALGEMHRVLEPGGKALLSLPNLAHFASRLTFLLLGKLIRTSTIDRHPGDRPIVEFVELIERAGFEVIARKGLFPTYPVISLATWVSPARALPLHRLLNASLAPPDLCFLNIFELRRIP